MRRRGLSVTKEVYLPDSLLATFRNKEGFCLKEHALLACFIGSRAHNTYFPLDGTKLGIDDLDVLCVVQAPPGWLEVRLSEPPWDVRVKSLEAFQVGLRLGAVDVEALWTRVSDRAVQGPLIQPLFDRKTDFLTPAYRNLLLLRSHAFGTLMVERPDHLYQGFLGPERKALAVSNGYDTCCAAHHIRLLKMVGELDAGKEPATWRADDDGLLRAIKRGYFKLSEVETMSTRLQSRLR